MLGYGTAQADFAMAQLGNDATSDAKAKCRQAKPGAGTAGQGVAMALLRTAWAWL